MDREIEIIGCDRGGDAAPVVGDARDALGIERDDARARSP